MCTNVLRTIAFTVTTFVIGSSAITEANEYRVIANRDSYSKWTVKYRVLTNTATGFKSCIEVSEGFDINIEVENAKSQFTIYGNQGWRCVTRSNSEHYMLWENNGDGLFDAYFASSKRIRYGNKLVEIEDSLSAPRESVRELSNEWRPRQFRFQENQWTLFLRKNGASPPHSPTEYSYSLPASKIRPIARSVRLEDLPSMLQSLSWQKPEWLASSELDFVAVSHQETKVDGSKKRLEFKTLLDVPLELVVDDANVISWRYGRVYSQAFVYPATGGTYCSRLSTGPFQYNDSNGDGLFDAFFNSDADELIEIRPSSLVRRNKYLYRYGWLLYSGLGLLGFVFLARFWHYRKREKREGHAVRSDT